jgi:adenosylcobinamide-phosphate synthase
MADGPPWSWVVLAALGLEAALGYPVWLLRLGPHPVAWPAALIEGLERRWNRSIHAPAKRRGLGVAVVAILVGLAVLFGVILQGLLGEGRFGQAMIALIATVGLAQNSLHQHVVAVLVPLRFGDLEAARLAVGRIVGRDTAELDAGQVAAAALESLAESFNDGVVAPAFWLLVGGLPGLFAYKSVNTADSLIGHMELRWRAFGWAAARTDDLMNLVPARLCAGLLVLAAGARWRSAWRTLRRDARLHASPNAGWPEAAMAGALGVSLGGLARYDGAPAERPVFGDGPTPTAQDLERGLAVYRLACALLWLIPLTIGAVAVLAR